MKKQNLTLLQLNKRMISNIQGGANSNGIGRAPTKTEGKVCLTARPKECPIPPKNS